MCNLIIVDFEIQIFILCTCSLSLRTYFCSVNSQPSSSLFQQTNGVPHYHLRQPVMHHNNLYQDITTMIEH